MLTIKTDTLITTKFRFGSKTLNRSQNVWNSPSLKPPSFHHFKPHKPSYLFSNLFLFNHILLSPCKYCIHYPPMAACGSLQHIFETPLPENPTLLDTLSSWSQIIAVTPSEQQSSFTEIFGELHFKESFVPPLSPQLSLTESNSPSPAAVGIIPWKEPLSNGESSSSHGRSNSFSSTNSESLQLCTEGLGYESLDDGEDLKGGMDEEEWQREEEEEETLKKQIQNPIWKPGMIKRTKSANVDDFPPPISCMGNSGKPWVGFKSYRYGGRFILKEIRVPTHEFLHASRENGRLKLHILVPNKQTRDAKEEDDDNKQQQQEQHEE
ncbi:uncharacterized protein LOC111449517 isoform X2 [Cucurbita moschata]|uniref:Uncharacterized protein LOC111449517 isoform X2 n=1 Tax=Cucurbita moschata TaxID=3662 RepID=A0A6J1G079_CUCMO|nr:uncharacterized protein LOC111449517 isoform X2 [Cucurbita moschata]